MDSCFRSVILRLRQANHTRRFYALSTGEARYVPSINLVTAQIPITSPHC